MGIFRVHLAGIGCNGLTFQVGEELRSRSISLYKGHALSASDSSSLSPRTVG